MATVLTVISSGISGLSAVRRRAATTIWNAESSPEKMLEDVAGILGSIAADDFAAYAPAEVKVLASTRLEASRCTEGADAFDKSVAAFALVDQA